MQIGPSTEVIVKIVIKSSITQKDSMHKTLELNYVWVLAQE